MRDRIEVDDRQPGGETPARKETPMRAVRTSLAAATLLGILPALAVAQGPQASEMLSYRPTQRGVEYDTPTEKAAIEACKVESVLNKDKKAIGWALRDGQGQLLRRFVDTNGTLSQRDREPKPG